MIGSLSPNCASKQMKARKTWMFWLAFDAVNFSLKNLIYIHTLLGNVLVVITDWLCFFTFQSFNFDNFDIANLLGRSLQFRHCFLFHWD